MLNFFGVPPATLTVPARIFFRLPAKIAKIRYFSPIYRVVSKPKGFFSEYYKPPIFYQKKLYDRTEDAKFFGVPAATSSVPARFFLIASKNSLK